MTQWAFPYEGVVAQYREVVATNAGHLRVFGDGSWLIDHLDESNPDAGLLPAAQHFLLDTTPGKVAGALLLLAGAFGVGYGIAAAVDPDRS